MSDDGAGRVFDVHEAMREVRKETDTVLLAFSGGKDSVCAWLMLREVFPRIVPIFRYWLPGLEFIEVGLRYYERFFGTKIIRVPHPGWYDFMRYGVFQTPMTYQVTEAWDYKRVEFDHQRDWIAEELGLDPGWLATGMRAAESVRRMFTVKKYGVLNRNNHVFYPVAYYRKDDVIRALRSSGVKLGLDYRIMGRSFDGVQFTFLDPVRRHFPKDYETIKRWLPLVELEYARKEVYDREKARQAAAH